MPDCGSSGFFDSSLPFPLEAEDEEYYNETHVVDEDNSWADELTALLERVQPLASPSDAFAAQLLEDMRVLTRLLTRDDRPVDVVVLATRLAAVGYRVVVRTAIGGGDSCFRNLHNEFLCVTDVQCGRHVEYIADPLFLSHFKISNPTQLYAALFEQLPAEFVGTAPQLTPLVQLLCSQMHASFKQQSLTLPPWRQARSMLSKWLPVRVRDSAPVCPPASPQQQLQQPQLESSQPPVLPGGSQQWHALDELRQPGAANGSCTATSPTQLKKSLLAGRLHLAPTKSLPPSIVVTPSPFRGQPPTYTVKMGA